LYEILREETKKRGVAGTRITLTQLATGQKKQTFTAQPDKKVKTKPNSEPLQSLS